MGLGVTFMLLVLSAMVTLWREQCVDKTSTRSFIMLLLLLLLLMLLLWVLLVLLVLLLEFVLVLVIANNCFAEVKSVLPVVFLVVVL